MTAALAILTLALASSTMSTGATESSSVPKTLDSVSAANIAETIDYLQGLGTREFHTAGAAQAAEYIHDEFESMGVDVHYQSFTLDSVNVSNVVATIPGTSSDGGVYLVGAHYDSENQAVNTYEEAVSIAAPGADDDASGVAAVLEIARAISSSGLTIERTIKFVAFGAEEMGYNGTGGLQGSSYFVANEIDDGVEYEGTAILDMIGFRDGTENVVSFIKESDSDSLAEAVVSAVDENGIDLRIDQYTAPGATYSDHAQFWYAQYPSFLAIEEMEPEELMPVNPYYHTSGDTLSTLSLDQARAVTQAVAGGLLELTAAEEAGDGVPVEVVAAGVAAGAGGIAVAAYYFVRRRSGR